MVTSRRYLFQGKQIMLHEDKVDRTLIAFLKINSYDKNPHINTLIMFRLNQYTIYHLKVYETPAETLQKKETIVIKRKSYANLRKMTNCLV